MDNLRGLLGIRRMDRVPNARIRKLWRMKRGLDERIDEGVLRCSGKWRGWRVIVLPRESMWLCDGSRSVGRPRKRWIDNVKECLKKRFGCQPSKENGPGQE